MKDKKLTVTIAADEYHAAMVTCAERGMKLSPVVRRLVADWVDTPPPDPEDVANLEKVLEELANELQGRFWTPEGEAQALRNVAASIRYVLGVMEARIVEVEYAQTLSYV